MSKMKTWEEFLNSKNKNVNEGLEDNFIKGSHLLTGDFKKDNTTGVRQDAESSNNPKHYEELQKFLAGRNKPEKVVVKDGWFVYEESTGQFWIEDHWGLILSEEDAKKALLNTERSANLLAEYLRGKTIALDKVPEHIRQMVV